MDSRLQNTCRYCLVLVAATALLAFPSSARADEINLSLNVFYSQPNDQNSGGTWQLAAKSDGNGIAGVVALLRDIDTTNPANTQFTGPAATVNTNDPAGFNLNLAQFQSSYYSLVMAQVPLGTADPEQTVFYGVGSIIDPDGGVPNYPGAATDYPGSSTVGPVYTTLNSATLANAVWGNGDPLGESDWNHAAILAQGVFAPGVTPSFYSDAENRSTGSIFTSLPATSSGLGDRTDSGSPIVASTIVRTNYDPSLLTGDFNGDGMVDLADYTVWRNNLGAAVDPPGQGLDPDGSGFVDFDDYLIWKDHLGAGVPGSGSIGGVAANAIPEPQSGAIALVFMGFALVVPRVGRCGKYRCSRFSVNFP